jgi:hypothetical protein
MIEIIGIIFLIFIAIAMLPLAILLSGVMCLFGGNIILGIVLIFVGLVMMN